MQRVARRYFARINSGDRPRILRGVEDLFALFGTIFPFHHMLDFLAFGGERHRWSDGNVAGRCSKKSVIHRIAIDFAENIRKLTVK